MSMPEPVARFLTEFSAWASNRSDILGVALIGSYARGEATESSDVDVVIVAEQPDEYLQDRSWVRTFGTVRDIERKDYGRLTALRARYDQGLEVEYGVTDEDWAADPLDEKTREVISAGMRVLFERGDELGKRSRSWLRASRWRHNDS